MLRRLHIGGKQKKDGWEILNIMPGPDVDHVSDAQDLSRFPDHTFEEVYASHILEHVDYRDGMLTNTLKEWRRVLGPRGRLYISVPDMDVLARLFLDKNRLDINERFQIMRMMFGGHMDEYDYHVVGLNLEILTAFLGEAGFSRLTRVEEFGIFEADTSTLRVHQELISLNVIADTSSS